MQVRQLGDDAARQVTVAGTATRPAHRHPVPMQITLANIDAMNFAGLVLAFRTSMTIRLAGNLHTFTCSMASRMRRGRQLIANNVAPFCVERDVSGRN